MPNDANSFSLAEDGLGAAGQADILGVLGDLGPLDAAHRTEFERVIVAVDAHFVDRHGHFLRIFGERNLVAATRAADGRQFRGSQRRRGDLAVEHVKDALGNVFAGKSEMLDEFPGISGNAEAIGHADHAELQWQTEIGAMLKDRSGDDVAEAAGLVLFDGNNDASFVGGTDDGGNVERLDGVNIHDAGFDAILFFQEPGSAHGFWNHRSTSDDRNGRVLVAVASAEESVESVDEPSLWAAIANDVGDAEFVGRVDSGDHGRGFASEANVAGAVQRKQ